MTWLARLKKTQTAPQRDATNATKPGFVAFVASIAAPIQKTEGVSAAANDPGQTVGLVGSSAVATLVSSQTPVFIEPPDPNAWRELATAYHLHHFKCSTCIAAGRGAVYGLRCGTGAALWTSYQNT